METEYKPIQAIYRLSKHTTLEEDVGEAPISVDGYPEAIMVGDHKYVPAKDDESGEPL